LLLSLSSGTTSSRNGIESRESTIRAVAGVARNSVGPTRVIPLSASAVRRIAATSPVGSHTAMNSVTAAPPGVIEPRIRITLVPCSRSIEMPPAPPVTAVFSTRTKSVGGSSSTVAGCPGSPGRTRTMIEPAS
jgi:hypothetical protein